MAVAEEEDSCNKNEVVIKYLITDRETILQYKICVALKYYYILTVWYYSLNF